MGLSKNGERLADQPLQPRADKGTAKIRSGYRGRGAGGERLPEHEQSELKFRTSDGRTEKGSWQWPR